MSGDQAIRQPDEQARGEWSEVRGHGRRLRSQNSTGVNATALVECVGYGDSLPLEVLEGPVGDAVKLVAHRENDTSTERYRSEGTTLSEESPNDVFEYFWIDDGAIDELTGDDGLGYATIETGGFDASVSSPEPRGSLW